MVSRKPSRHQPPPVRRAATSQHPVVEQGTAPSSHESCRRLVYSATGSYAPVHHSPPPPSVSLPLSLRNLPYPSTLHLCTHCPLGSDAIAQPAVGRHESIPLARYRSGAPSVLPSRL